MQVSATLEAEKFSFFFFVNNFVFLFFCHFLSEVVVSPHWGIVKTLRTNISCTEHFFNDCDFAFLYFPSQFPFFLLWRQEKTKLNIYWKIKKKIWIIFFTAKSQLFPKKNVNKIKKKTGKQITCKKNKKINNFKQKKLLLLLRVCYLTCKIRRKFHRT